MKKYIVQMMNKGEVEITEQEFESLKGREGAVYVPSLDQIVNLNRVERIYTKPPEQLFIPKERRLDEAQEMKDKKLVGISEGMKNTFDKMKSLGLFVNFNSYEEWQQTKFPKAEKAERATDDIDVSKIQF